MRILGIDPGLQTTGFGVLDVEGGAKVGLHARRAVGVGRGLAAERFDAGPFWRVSRCLVDALAMLRATDPELAVQIADRISDPRVRAKAARALRERGTCAPRTYFRES